MRTILWKALMLIAWALLCAFSAALLLSAQRQAEDDLKQRFENRADVAARFVQNYTRDLLEQERRVAAREFSGASVSSADFERITNLLGYEAAVLLDARGRALQSVPAKSSLIGKDLTKKYTHLRAAAAGGTAISKVVPSAAKGVPVVAFATPFYAGRGGNRVFSGAFNVETTPIGAFLHNVTPLKGARAYLLDSSGAIVASSRNKLDGLKSLTEADPKLARALAHSPASTTSTGYKYASQPVTGAPWRLVLSVPAAQLFHPLQGLRRWVPWMLWAGFVLGALACALMVGRLITSGTKLRAANDDLDRLARIDGLTGLYNRRQIQASLDEALATARRHDQPLSALMIDIDHFKEINDTHGHGVGDEMLRFVANVMLHELRGGDLVGRWGGEEFLAVLPHTDRSGAQRVAERVREAISLTPVVVGDQLIPISVSIGAAALTGDHSDGLVSEADTAMYAAKTAGRDTVRVAD